MIKKKTISLLALLLLLSLAASAHESKALSSGSTVNAPPPNPTAATQIFIVPYNTTDLTRVSGSFTVSVNVTAAPSFASFEVIIHYNNDSLQATSLDWSSGVLGGDAKTVIYCVDGSAPPPLSCDARYAAQGTIALSLTSLSGATGNITRAMTLFKINFHVGGSGLSQIHPGLSQIHIYSASLGLAVPSKDRLAGIVFNTFDAFFSNKACSSKACQPPTVRVSYSPTTVPRDAFVTFNVTISNPNAGARVLSYTWDWGDGTQQDPQTDSTSPPIGQPEVHQFLSSRFGLNTACVNRGLCLVGLTTLDSLGVSWETTIRVPIQFLNIVLTVGDPDVSPQYHVLPGTTVKISARIDNTGNVNVNATLTIRLESIMNLTRPHYFPLLAASGGEGSLSATWDTSGFAPRAYAVIAEISNTSALVGDKPVHFLNATSLPLSASYVLLVSPVVAGNLSLSILQTTGLGILIVVAVVVALTRFLRKPSYLEPL